MYNTGSCGICHEFFKVSFAYEIVTNFLNWHMANFELGQGKQGFRKLDLSGDPAVCYLFLK